MPRDLLRPAKHRVQSLRPELVALHLRLVPDSQLFGDLCRSLLVAKQNHFHVRMEQCPALQRILLDDSVVSAERLRRREEREHFVPSSVLAGPATSTGPAVKQ